MEDCVTFNGCCLVSLFLLFWVTVVYTVHFQNWNLKLSKLEVIFVPWITDIYPCMVTSPRPPCEMLLPGQTPSTFASTYIRFWNHSPLSTVLNRFLMNVKAWWNLLPTQQSTSFKQNFIELILKPFARRFSFGQGDYIFISKIIMIS